MTSDQGGLGHIMPESLQNLGQRQSFGMGPLGGDSVDLGRVIRDIKTLRLNNQSMGGHQTTDLVQQLPPHLHRPGPVVGITDRRFVVAR